MRFELIYDGNTELTDLVDGVVTVGGAKADGIFIEGLPHTLLTLEIDGDALAVTAKRSLRIGSSLFPARVRRLVLAGEELKLPNDIVLRRVRDVAARNSRKTVGTAFVAGELLQGGELELAHTRAASLTCVAGLDAGRTWALAFDEHLIGRADDATVQVRDRAVSRKHARLFRKGKAWLLEPVTGSMNGAYLNGRLLKQATLLEEGDTLEVGHTVLRFDVSARAPEEQTVLGLQAPQAATTPKPDGTAMAVSEIKLAAEPIPAPHAADAMVPAPSTATIEAQTPFPLEAILMSVGVGLAMLGIAAVTLVLR
ncbi:MAG: FHA domain-containing protein [Myxococcaceae bacterium]